MTELGVAFDYPTGLATDDEGNLYVSDTHQGAVRRVSTEGQVTTVAKELEDPMGLYWSDGMLYIAETGANRIVKLDPKSGTLEEVAGSGVSGSEDGDISKARFSSPQRVIGSSDGTLYISDTGNGKVRRISAGQVTTIETKERLFSPAGLLLQEDTLYICDSFTRRIHCVKLETTP